VGRKVGRHVTVVQGGVARVRGRQGPVVDGGTVQAGELVEDDERGSDRPGPA
jgi:hypothetical protein